MLFGISGKARLFLYSGSADTCLAGRQVRNGFDGLSGLVINKLKQDQLSGDIFIFINRTRTHIKLLVWDETRFTIWHKRLEQGTFGMPDAELSIHLLVVLIVF